MGLIHATALVDPQAELAADVTVGPYAVIGPHVRIGEGSSIGAHCVVDGHTTIGRDNRIFQFASIGAAPQDMKYRGEPTRLVIGDRNTFREFVTVNTGTVQDGGVTRVGDDNWVMAYVHIAHDVQLGSHCVLANNATLAGHVHLGDWVFLGGFTTIHQFCKIGTHAMTAFTAAVTQDVPPYVTAAGNRAAPAGINSEGLRRRGYTAEQITEIKRAYKLLYRQGLSLEEACAEIVARASTRPELQAFVDFFPTATRGLIR